jgi:hypothetical protein
LVLFYNLLKFAIRIVQPAKIVQVVALVHYFQIEIPLIYVCAVMAITTIVILIAQVIKINIFSFFIP